MVRSSKCSRDMKSKDKIGSKGKMVKDGENKPKGKPKKQRKEFDENTEF